MLLCGIGAKPVAHSMQYHLLQWEVAKVKQLMTSNMTLTVLNLHEKTQGIIGQGQRSNQGHTMTFYIYTP